MMIEHCISKEAQFHMNTYARLPVVFVKGKGCRLWDVEGREYLDFVGGLGVASVGHCHPVVIEKIKNQLDKLIHVSNLYYTLPQLELAEKLVSLSFADKCFFANSGAEVNEGAVKLVRKYAKSTTGKDKYEIITAFRSFHGRTMKMLAASGQPEKQESFEPLPLGFTHVPLNDLEALEEAIGKHTCAVMLEPIQGEGGVYPCEIDYLRDVRRICDKHGLLLVLDEVQTGLGRTGKMFAYEHFGIVPDIMSLAKGLGGGLPIGTFVATDKVASTFKPGDHGSTFGGGPLVCTAALAVLEVIENEALVKNCFNVGAYFKEGLLKLAKERAIIKEIRGLGLMLGVELTETVAKEITLKVLSKGLVINNIGGNILRFLPPLCVTKGEIDIVLEVLDDCFKEAL